MRIDLRQLKFIEMTMSEMLSDIEHELGFEFLGTSFYRDGDSGVHGQMPLRGVDVRCRVDVIGDAIEAYVNNRWQYDPERPQKKCCIYHDVGQGKHLHFQVHPNTQKRGGYL